jgi:hypothetical protein
MFLTISTVYFPVNVPALLYVPLLLREWDIVHVVVYIKKPRLGGVIYEAKGIMLILQMRIQV